jgi:hypothetical protein
VVLLLTGEIKSAANNEIKLPHSLFKPAPAEEPLPSKVPVYQTPESPGKPENIPISAPASS